MDSRYGSEAKLSLTLEEWFNLLEHKYPYLSNDRKDWPKF